MKAENYVVAIPSYKRSKLVSKNTLHTLISKKVPKEKIYIFVANEKEKQDYLENVPKNMYHRIIVGVIGLRDQRNYITKYFPEKQLIVELDDDVKDVLKLIPGKGKNREEIQKNNKLSPIKDLHSFIIVAFNTLITNGKKPHLWGVYPVDNPYFMSDKVTDDLRFVVGPMWGKINRKNKALTLKLNEKEDFERTLRHYKMDKSVIRFNNVTINTAYYTTPGGMQSEDKDRYVEAEKSANFLEKNFPKLVTKYYKGKTKRPEVRLKDSDDKKTKVNTANKKYNKKTRRKTKKETK